MALQNKSQNIHWRVEIVNSLRGGLPTTWSRIFYRIRLRDQEYRVALAPLHPRTVWNSISFSIYFPCLKFVFYGFRIVRRRLRLTALRIIILIFQQPGRQGRRRSFVFAISTKSTNFCLFENSSLRSSLLQ